MDTPFAHQSLKPQNAAKKLGVYLPATPREFQEHAITRAELEELEKNPPQWLADLRRNGPHPRPVVAGRLGISISGLTRGGVTEPLTTEQIDALREDPPQWLVRERETFAQVLAEEDRIAAQRQADEQKRARKAAPKPHAAPQRGTAPEREG